MRSFAVIVLCMFARSTSAAPPSGYQCDPGTAVKGVGCSCPKGTVGKRDTDNVAVCATAEQQSAAQQFVKAVGKGDLATAQALARRINILKDQGATTALANSFKSWLATEVPKLALQSARGQCSLVIAGQRRGAEYRGVFLAMIDPLGKVRQDLADQLHDQIDDIVRQQLGPLAKLRDDCLAVAAKDDGTPAIAAAYATHKRELAGCFSRVPEPKQLITAKVVVEAEGKVVDVGITAVWADLEAKLAAPTAKQLEDIERLRKAYEAAKGPQTLYDLAVAQDAAGLAEAAQDSYRGYLAIAPAEHPQRATANERIERLARLRKERSEIQTTADVRTMCFQQAIATWSFAANARGFAGTITLARP